MNEKEENGIGIDTCFLISFVNPDDSLHKNADDYFRYFIEKGITLYFPIICWSEIMERQPTLEILENFKLLSFSLAEAAVQHKHFSRADVNGKNNKVEVKDDIKIIATFLANDVKLVVTANEDFITLAKSKDINIIDYREPLTTYLGALPFPQTESA